MPHSARGSKRNLVLALAAAALVAGGAFVMTRGSGTERPVAEAARPVPTPVAPTPSAAVAPAVEAETIELVLAAEPENAVLYVDGSAVSNPYRAKVPRDSLPHKVLAKAEGYLESEQEVEFDRAREVTISLREKPGPTRKVAVRGHPRPTPAAGTPTQPAPAPAPASQDTGMPVVQKKIRTLDSENPFAPGSK